MKDVGMSVVERFPAYSPDLNPIENCWRLLKGLLDKRIPPERDTRRAQVRAIHDAVKKINRNHRDLLMHLKDSMKDRARDVLALKGARKRY